MVATFRLVGTVYPIRVRLLMPERLIMKVQIFVRLMLLLRIRMGVPAYIRARAVSVIFARHSFTLEVWPHVRVTRVTLVTVVVRPVAMAQEWDNAVMHLVRHVLDR